MSNQPVDDKKLKGNETYLVDRITGKNPVVLGMEIQGRYGSFKLLGLEDGKLIVVAERSFISNAIDLKDAIKIIASAENEDIDFYKDKKIETTYVAEEETIETKLREEAMPKKPTAKNSINVWDKTFYIVKKSPNGKSSGKIFCLYNWHTRNLIWAHHDRDMLIGFLMTKYQEIEDKDI